VNRTLQVFALVAALVLPMKVPSCGKPLGQQPNVKPLNSKAPINPPKTTDDRKRRVEFIVTWWPRDREVSIAWQVDTRRQTLVLTGPGKFEEKRDAAKGSLAFLDVQTADPISPVEWITCMIKIDGRRIQQVGEGEGLPFAHVKDGQPCHAEAIIR